MSGKTRPSLIKKTLENVKRCNLSQTDKDCIAEVLEKQIPKKVELYTNDGNFKWQNYPCPCCKEMLGLNVNKRYVKFCQNCGQALDWGDGE